MWGNKGWKKNIKSALKWTIIIILVFLLLNFLENFMNHYNLLIKKVEQQGQNINTLNNEVSNLIDLNHHLVKQIDLNTSNVHNLAIKINGQPISTPNTVPISDISSHVNKSNIINSLPTLVPVTIIGISQILKSLVNPIFAY